MTKPKIKICGLFRSEDIIAVNAAMPDFIGFVFVPKSKRCVTGELAAKLKKDLDPKITAVGVFANADPCFIISLVEQKIIDMVQLHGGEDDKYIDNLKNKVNAPIIKALSSPKNVPKNADYLLFDNKAAGSGLEWDWNKINEWKKELAAQGGSKPFFLAGGLNIQNIKNATAKTQPYAVDISTGVETNGVKDKEKIEKITKIVKGI